MLTIEHPRDDKTTRAGKTVIMDFGPDIHGWTGRHGLVDLLEAAGNFIDAAKIWTLNTATMPEAYIRQTARQYKDAGIETFAGGLLFEYAYLKNDVDGLIDLLRHVGIDGIEVSENYITLDGSERLSLIQMLADNGLHVVFEYGRKHPDTPMQIDGFEKIIMQVRELGVDHVILEQGEIDLLDAEQPGRLDEMTERPWFNHVFFEVESNRFPTQHVDLINRFGPTVNIANVAPGHVIRLEFLRRGMGRAIDYPLFHQLLAE